MNFQVGDKVRIKPGTRYEGQAHGSEYGIIKSMVPTSVGSISYHVDFYYDVFDPKNTMVSSPMYSPGMLSPYTMQRFAPGYSNSYENDDIEFYEKKKRRSSQKRRP
jgi:hypothetical protein